MAVNILPRAVLDTLAIKCGKRTKSRLLVQDFAFLIRQRELGGEVDLEPVCKAVADQLGSKTLASIMARAWRKYREWYRETRNKQIDELVGKVSSRLHGRCSTCHWPVEDGEEVCGQCTDTKLSNQVRGLGELAKKAPVPK